MKFGIFYEHQLPRPWEEDSERQLIQNALEQVELADRLGFDVVWEVEHHFLEEYSHSSAPEVFLAAASQRTKNIRLGHGIVQTPPPFNHPARVAERIATLDLLSNGRVDFGTGESSSEAELGAFLIDPEEAEHWMRDYYETLAKECVPIGDAVNANLACVTPMMCHPDEEQALARGLEGANFFGYSLAHYYVFGRHRPGVTDVWAEYEQQRAEHGYDPVAVELAARHGEVLGAKVVSSGFSGLRGAIGT